MLTILSAAFLILQPAAAPVITYSCDNGRSYAVEAATDGLVVTPDGLHARRLADTGETGLARFTDGGLSLILQGEVVMIGAPEQESVCKISG